MLMYCHLIISPQITTFFILKTADLPWTCPAGPAQSYPFCCRVSSHPTCPSLRISGVRQTRLFPLLKDLTSRSRETRDALRSRRSVEPHRTYNLFLSHIMSNTHFFASSAWATPFHTVPSRWARQPRPHPAI